ncbi:MAG: hypothetical protein ACOH2J_04205 [Allorhizobium sp.]
MSALSLLAVLAGCNAGNPGAALGSGTVAPAASQVGVVQGTCPAITLRDGTASYRTYAKGTKDDPTKVVYQASLAETTRACTRSETELSIAVMVQGRLVAGPMGGAGTLSMPIRVEVTDGDQVLYSEVSKLDASLADAGQGAQFVFTKDVIVPGSVSSFAKVYVGFDQGPTKKK